MIDNQYIQSLGPKNISKRFIPIVLCAGFGTRLKPITNVIPKVICPVIDKPLAFYSIGKFFQAGFEKVYCNTHYMPELVKNELKTCAKNFGYNPERIVFFNEENILGSGGGVLNIVQNLCNQDIENKEKDVIVVSGDIVANFPLHSMIRLWEKRQKNDLVLMLSLPVNEPRDDVLCVSQDQTKVLGFGKSYLESHSHLNPTPRLFSNHQIIAAEVFENCALQSQSIVQMFYQKILDQNDKNIIHSSYPETCYWFNVGDIAEYEKCIRYFCTEKNLSYPQSNKMHHNHVDLIEQIKELCSQTGIQINCHNS